MSLTLAESIADKIRERVISGWLTPAATSLKSPCAKNSVCLVTRCAKFSVLLTKEGLLRHEANRGVS